MFLVRDIIRICELVTEEAKFRGISCKLLSRYCTVIIVTYGFFKHITEKKKTNFFPPFSRISRVCSYTYLKVKFYEQIFQKKIICAIYCICNKIAPILLLYWRRFFMHF